MDDKTFAHYVTKATGLVASTTTEALRRVEKTLRGLAESADEIHRGWPLRLLKEARWRLAVRHAEATSFRKHLAYQEVRLDEGDFTPFCGTHRVRRAKYKRRHPPERADMTQDPLEVTCVKCWRRLLAEAQDRLASFEEAKVQVMREEVA